jgi:eukaryotic-like serine/threonine-protein kinase
MNNFSNREGTPDKPAARTASPSASVQLADMERIANAMSYRFDVLKALGADAGCEYYLAREIVQKNLVGLKVLRAHVARDVIKREMFYLESNVASKLSHFNIVRCGKPEKIEGIHFSVFEYKQEASTLRDLLDRGGWLAIHKAVEISDQIASALDYAHSAGVLHLNLRPENVLVEPDGWVSVKGFGLESRARMDWAYVERSQAMAAPYLSAEQAMGEKMDHRSDLYSLGVILYELLTDRVPFDSDDVDYVKQRQVKDGPAPPHLISMVVSEEVSSVVMQLLQRDPNNRFQNAAAFQTALDSAINAGRELERANR